MAIAEVEKDFKSSTCNTKGKNMKKLSVTLKLLKATRRLLSKKERWTKNISARNKYGERTNPSDPKAYSFCLTGAIYKIAFRLNVSYSEKGETIILLKDHLQGCFRKDNDRLANNTLIEYNDHWQTQHKDILNLLDKTISSYEKKERTRI